MQDAFVSTADIVTNKQNIKISCFIEVYIPGGTVKKTDNSNKMQHVLHLILINTTGNNIKGKG